MKHVLFVCNHNAGRSQMARRSSSGTRPADIRAESAGSSPRAGLARGRPGDGRGRRRSSDRAKLLRRCSCTPTGRSRWAAATPAPTSRRPSRSWDIPDPAGRPLEEVREIRDGIEQRVSELIEGELDAIRADRLRISCAWRSSCRARRRVRGRPHPARSARAPTRSSRATTMPIRSPSSRSRSAKLATAYARRAATR